LAKVFAELEAMKVSTAEANKLGALGEDLKNAGTADPNKYHRRIDKSKRPRRGPDPADGFIAINTRNTLSALTGPKQIIYPTV